MNDAVRSLSTWARPGAVGRRSVHSVATCETCWPAPRTCRHRAGQDHVAAARAGLRAQGEQAPNPESRVRLGSRRDDLGIPVPRVTWRSTDDDLASVKASAQVLSHTLRARASVSLTGPRPGHHAGGGQPSPFGYDEDARGSGQGRRDPDGKVHSVDNLYVAGSSVFPTYGASNPTLTIVALSIRLADHLRELLGRTASATSGGPFRRQRLMDLASRPVP